MSSIRPAHALVSILLVAALIGPAAARHVLDGGPDLTFSQGPDWARAAELGFAAGFRTRDGGRAFDLTLSGLAGGTVTVDRLVRIDAGDDVDGYRWLVEDPATLGGAELVARLWTGASPPSADGDASVCSVADLTRPGPSIGRCPAGRTHVQVVYTLPSGADGADVVRIRPEIVVSGTV